jgi:phage-related tail fiber protein
MPIFRGKNFVSSVSDYKDSVRVAVRSNINLSGTVSVIDGVTLADKDRVLIAGQSTNSQNGIYTWSSSNSRLTRASDADSTFELSAGNRIYVEEGNTNGKTNWVLITTGVITPGVTGIVFSKESHVGPIAQYGTFGSANKTLQIQVDETGQVDSITELDINLDGGEF